MKVSHLNKNVLKASALISVMLCLVGVLLVYLFQLSTLSILLFALFSFIVVFISVRIYLRQFILNELRKVYDSSLFENEPFLKKESNELDFELFLSKVKTFTENKLQEIEQLHNRDDFRKEFMGDVSHELKTPLFTAQGYLLTVLEGNMDDKKLEKNYQICQARAQQVGCICIGSFTEHETGNRSGRSPGDGRLDQGVICYNNVASFWRSDAFNPRV